MFQLFDEVELIGRDNRGEIPCGRRGTIMECIPTVDGYLVEFWESDDDHAIAGVQGSELRLVKGDASEEPLAEILSEKERGWERQVSK